MFSTPDITPAQITAALGFIVGQAVSWGWIDTGTSQTVVAIGAIVIPAVLAVADAIIRHGRAVGNAQKG